VAQEAHDVRPFVGAVLGLHEELARGRDGADDREVVARERGAEDGVCPRGASVRTTPGKRETPDSSTQAMTRPSSAASFFEGRPALPVPPLDRRLVALRGPLAGLLRAQAERADEAADVRRVVPDAAGAVDDRRNPVVAT